MKDINELENRYSIINKLRKIQNNLETYDRFIELSKQNPKNDVRATLTKIDLLREEKANEIYTIVRSYGWLSERDIGHDLYQMVIRTLKFGTRETLQLFVPFLEKAAQMHRISPEDYDLIMGYIENSKSGILLKNRIKALK